MKNKIKFVYFDVGGVILHFKHQFEELERIHGVDKEKAHEVWIRHIENLVLGKEEQSEVWRAICEETNSRHLLGLEWDKFRVGLNKPVESIHDLIAELEKSNIGIGLLSNAEKGIIRLNILKGTIPNAKYRHIVDSSEIRMKKPDRVIFEYAQSLIKVPKERVLLVDDLEKNCEAARDFGWQAVQFDEDNPSKSVADIRKLLDIH